MAEASGDRACRGRALTPAIIVASTIVAAFSGSQPTGSGPVDHVLAGVCALAVTWAAASSPWWALASAAGLAAVASSAALLLVVAVVTAFAGLVVGLRRANDGRVNTALGAVVVQVLLRLDLNAPFGISALIAATGLITVFVPGIARQSPQVRRHARLVLVGLAATGCIAIAGLIVSAWSASDPLRDGNRAVHDGLDALNIGDLHRAADEFRSAANAFARADDDLDSLIAQPSRLIPIVAQHRASGIALARAAAQAMGAAADALERIDPATVRVRDGRIDLDAVRRLTEPFTDLRIAIAQMTAALDRAESPWLIAPIQRRLRELEGDLEDNITRADNALEAVRLAPDLLGGNGTRRYFIAFTSPAEARGLGGFMGNWAEVEINDGHIEMTDFGRADDLNDGGADPRNRRVNISDPQVAQRWGRFGLSGRDGVVSRDAWDNITMPPDFPTVADLIAQLYPQSGGRDVDGVFMLDANAIAALMSFTGPIVVDGVPYPLSAANAAQFITNDQYLFASTDQRIDLLDEIAHTTVERLLSSALPEPAEIARTFAPLATTRGFAVWSRVPEEEAFLTRIGLDGGFEPLDGHDGIGVTVDNASANKIDAYLSMGVVYAVSPRDNVGNQSATMTVTITNMAPSTGLPEYVIGNVVGNPMGVNRMMLSLYTALPMEFATLDGAPTTLETGSVFGWNVASQFVDIAPGATRTFVLHLRGPLAPEPYRLVTNLQPLRTPITVAAVGP